MNDIFAHPLFAAIDQKALETELYAKSFNNEAVVITGESPYLRGTDAGIELALSNKHKINAVHLYNGTLEGYCRYGDALPGGLTFETNRDAVKAALGTPSMSGEPGGIGIMALDYSFDRFENERYYISVRYEAGNQAIKMVTLGLA